MSLCTNTTLNPSLSSSSVACSDVRPITSGMATCWGLPELVGLLDLVGLLELVGRVDLVGLPEVGWLSLVGSVARPAGTRELMVGFGRGVGLRVGGLVLPGVIDEETETLEVVWGAGEVGEW